MARYVLYDPKAKEVVNVIEWDGVTKYEPAGYTVRRYKAADKESFETASDARHARDQDLAPGK